MAAQTEQPLYMDEGFIDPLMAQQAFSESFDLDNPRQAAADYAKIMRAHTERQLKGLGNSRRTPAKSDGTNSTASLTPESSTNSSSSEVSVA